MRICQLQIASHNIIIRHVQSSNCRCTLHFHHFISFNFNFYFPFACCSTAYIYAWTYWVIKCCYCCMRDAIVCHHHRQCRCHRHRRHHHTASDKKQLNCKALFAWCFHFHFTDWHVMDDLGDKTINELPWLNGSTWTNLGYRLENRNESLADNRFPFLVLYLLWLCLSG